MKGSSNDLDLLEKGLTQLNLNLPPSSKGKLIEYTQLLAKWNKAYNLTAVRAPSDMITAHLLDSLSIAPYLYGQRLLDVGSGAGLPGIPLALAFPDKQFVLLDSSQKKTTFLSQVRYDLNLNNVTVVTHRAEEFKSESGFDTVMSRAFSSIKEMLERTHHLCKPSGRFLHMKGRYPKLELEEIGKEYKILAIHHLEVPGLDAERHVVIIEGPRSG